MRVFFCADERKMLRSEKISSRLFRRSRGERSDKKERAEEKRLIERNFLTTEEKNRKILFFVLRVLF